MDELTRRTCIEHPPNLVSEQPRYQLEALSPRLVELLGDAAPPPQPVWNLDGVPWTDHQAPPADHEHWAQTVGQPEMFVETRRCPCGAFGDGAGNWFNLDHPPPGLRSDL